MVIVKLVDYCCGIFGSELFGFLLSSYMSPYVDMKNWAICIENGLRLFQVFKCWLFG